MALGLEFKASAPFSMTLLEVGGKRGYIQGANSMKVIKYIRKRQKNVYASVI